jgi:hypothetical protein
MTETINYTPPADPAETPPAEKRRKYSTIGIISSFVGVALFGYFLWKADVRTVWAGINRLGYGAVWILIISAMRTIFRAWAWKLCCEKPYELRLIDCWRGYVVGDAVGTLTPFGMLASEPAKAAVVSDRVPLSIGLSSLAVENIFYSLTAAFFVLTGISILLATYHLPRILRYFSIGTVIFVVGVIVILLLMVYREWRILSGAARKIAGRGLGREWLSARFEKLEHFEDRVYGFYERHQKRFLPVLLLNFGFHLAGVAEIYATLYFIYGAQISLFTAFLLESANRVITVAFKVVPLRAGVDEAGTGMLTKVLLHGDLTIGVTLAIIRKARGLVWMFVGLIIWFARGFFAPPVVLETGAIDPLVIVADDEQKIRVTKG